MNGIILCENVVYTQGMVAEHGLSILVKTEEENILFDTGQGIGVVCNSLALNEDLRKVTKVVLSHGHSDHTGGLENVLSINSTAKILLKESAFAEKYSNSTGTMRKIGMNLKQEKEDYKNEFVFVNEELEINKSVKLLGRISNYTDFENDENKMFVSKNNEFVKDNFEDELVMIVEDIDGLNIIVGCAHKGIINIIKTVQEKYKGKKIKSVLGGFHLKGKSEERKQKTIEELKKLDIDRFYINHCSGVDFYAEMKKEFGDRVEYAFVGFEVKM